MAYVLTLPTKVGRDDVAPGSRYNLWSWAAGVGNGMKFKNNGRMFLEIENSATPTIASVVTQVTVDGQAVDDPGFTIPAFETHLFGPFPPKIYNTPEGFVEVYFSDTTDGKVVIWRLL